MNLALSFIFGLSFICFQVEGHQTHGHQAEVHQGTDVSKYRLVPDGLSPTQHFHRTNTRGNIECGKHCSQAQNCKYFRYDAKYKICMLYTSQILVAAQNSTSFQVYVTGTSCYELVEEMSWYDAKTYCENKGGSLVIIKTAEKQVEITELLRQSASASNVHPWVGSIRESGQFEFVWTDGSAVPLGFKNWGEIDINYITDKCMYLNGFSGYRWYSAHCSTSFRSICEYVLT